MTNPFAQQGYPPPPATYTQQQFPGYPAPPQQFAYPQQAYAAPPQPQYTPAPPPPPLATGTLDDFYNQPSGGGGKSLAFPVIGTVHVGVVSRAITNGDIVQQTNVQGVPQFYKDGRPKLVMRVPLFVAPTPENPEGVATLYVKGGTRDELARAMAEAQAPSGAPEHGATIQIQYVGDRPIPGMTPAKQFRIEYTRPAGAAAVHPAVVSGKSPHEIAQEAAHAQAAQLVPPIPAAPIAPAPVAAAPPVAAQPLAVPADFNEQQAALLARLSNAAAPQQG